LHIGYWLAQIYLMKKFRQSAALFWFDLRYVGNLYSQAVIQKKIDVSPASLEHSSAEKMHMQTVIQTSRRIDSFLHEAAQNFEILLNIQDQK
jgi:hypothetical protein